MWVCPAADPHTHSLPGQLGSPRTPFASPQPPLARQSGLLRESWLPTDCSRPARFRTDNEGNSNLPFQRQARSCGWVHRGGRTRPCFCLGRFFAVDQLSAEIAEYSVDKVARKASLSGAVRARFRPSGSTGAPGPSPAGSNPPYRYTIGSVV